VHETHGVTRLVIIMFTDKVKDTVTLLLFYLLVIRACGVLPVGNVFFRRRFRDDLAVAQGRRRIAACIPQKHNELQAGGGPRTVQHSRAL